MLLKMSLENNDIFLYMDDYVIYNNEKNYIKQMEIKLSKVKNRKLFVKQQR